MDDQLPLARGQRLMMRALQRWGAYVLVGSITLFSVVVSVVSTWAWVLWGDMDAQYQTTAILQATVVPLVVAPLASTLVVRMTSVVIVANEQLDLMATTDPLTGLANRRRFFAVAERMSASYRTDGADVLIVAVSDVDAFKHVNDTYGHGTGDDVLVALAAGLRDAIGDLGLVGRLGGDEFACVLSVPEARATECQADLVAACQGVLSAAGVSFTASIGFHRVANGEGIDAALSLADGDLYRVKSERGRTPRAGCASQLPA